MHKKFRIKPREEEEVDRNGQKVNTKGGMKS